MTYPEHAWDNDSLTGDEFAQLEARYPGKEIILDLSNDLFRVYSDEKCVSAGLSLERAFKEAME